MQIEEARQIVERAKLATEPERLPSLSLAELRQHYDALCEARLVIIRNSYTTTDSNHILQLIRQEIKAKRSEEHSERHHAEVMEQGSDILVWTKRAVLAAVVVPILVALIAEIPFSRLLRAKASPALPTSSEQNQASTAPTITPTVAEPTSTQTPVSPTPEGASTPTP